MRHEKCSVRQVRPKHQSHAAARCSGTSTANLVLHERIETTDAKAKELRRVAERLITKARRLGDDLTRRLREAQAGGPHAVIARRLHVQRLIAAFLPLGTKTRHGRRRPKRSTSSQAVRRDRAALPRARQGGQGRRLHPHHQDHRAAATTRRWPSSSCCPPTPPELPIARLFPLRKHAKRPRARTARLVPSPTRGRGQGRQPGRVTSASSPGDPSLPVGCEPGARGRPQQQSEREERPGRQPDAPWGGAPHGPLALLEPIVEFRTARAGGSANAARAYPSVSSTPESSRASAPPRARPGAVAPRSAAAREPTREPRVAARSP